MEIAKIKPNLQIEVPTKIRQWLKTEKELAAFLEGDTLIFKKIRIPDVESIAERSSEKEMPLSEVVEEIHRFREGKKS